ncbi:MAG: leucine-rich repeat protein [Bacilli bacterium]|jgi:uncharacterized repeat protein (TIGR02543 family)|nr:leucine-rich repeat protein [Bacilli bacterium]
MKKNNSGRKHNPDGFWSKFCNFSPRCVGWKKATLTWSLLFLTSAVAVGPIIAFTTSCNHQEKTAFDLSSIVFNDSSFVYDGYKHSIYLNGQLPEGLSVSYINNEQTEVGTYRVTAKYLASDTNAYITPEPVSATMTIVQANISGISFVGKSVTYDGQPHSLEIMGTLPEGVSVTYSGNEVTEAGTHDVVAHFVSNNPDYVALPDMRASLTIKKARYDLSALSFNSYSCTYDGEIHSLQVEGTLPEGVSVSYLNNNQTNAGSYLVTARFLGDSDNYETIPDLTASLTISKASVKGISFAGQTVDYDGNEHALAISGTLPEGVSVSYSNNAQKAAGTYTVTAHFDDPKGNYVLPDLTATLTIRKALYDFSGISFPDLSTTYDGNPHSLSLLGTLPAGVSVSYSGSLSHTAAGSYNVTAHFSYDSANYEAIPDMTATLTIAKAPVAGVSFSGMTAVYDGTAHSLAIQGTLPEGITVSYYNNSQTDAGTYTVTAHFTDASGNYAALPDMTATLTIRKAVYDMSGISFADVSATYDGKDHSLAISGTLPEGVTVHYSGRTSYSAAGTYQVTASFTGDSANYETLASMTATLTISKASVQGISFAGKTAIYDGTEHSLAITGTLPSGVTVSYSNNGQTNAGSYVVTAHFDDPDGDYTLPDLTATLTIRKAHYDMSGISFADAAVTYDGTAHSLAISGTLPTGVSVSYVGNGDTKAGTYQVTASFEGDSLNYEPIPSMTANLIINKATLSLSLVGNTVVYDGTAHSLSLSGDLPMGVFVSYTNNGQINAGTYLVTAHFTDASGDYVPLPDMTATLTIRKAVYDMSAVSFADVSATYDGNGHSLAVSGNLPTGVTVSYSDSLTQINAGTYSVTASFHGDAANYENIADMTATLTIAKASVEGITFVGQTVVYDGHSHSLSINGYFPAGVTLSYVNNDHINAGTYTVTAHFDDPSGNYNLPDLSATLVINKATYDLTGITFANAAVTYDGNSHSLAIAGTLPTGVTVSYSGNGNVHAGTYGVTASFSGDSLNYEPIPDKTANLVINKASLTLSLSGKSVVYDGSAHSLEVSGFLPSGVVVSYTNNGQTNAGTYTVTASVVDNTGNYLAVADMSANLVIQKADYDLSSVSFNDTSVTYDGTAHSLTINGTLPSGVSVSYDKATSYTNAGTYLITASFQGDTVNHNPIADKSATLTISKAPLDMMSFSGSTFTYDGTAHSLAVTGSLPSGVSVSYSNNVQTNAGTYTVTAHFTDSTGNYLESDLTASLVINKASYDMSGITFENGQATYDGTAHSLAISGTLPTGLTVSYSGNGDINAGTYSVTASFAGDSLNYNAIDSLTATLVVNKASLSGIAFADGTADYDGSTHALAITGTLPEGVSVAYANNDQTEAGAYTITATFTDSTGNYSVPNPMSAVLTIYRVYTGLTFADATATYDGTAHSLAVSGTLPDGISVAYSNNGQTDVGTYTVTATFSGTNPNYYRVNTMTATLTVAKATPTLSPSVTNANVGTSSTVTLASGTSVPGTIVFDAGQTLTIGTSDYSYTFTPTDTANYNIVKGTISIDVKAEIRYYNYDASFYLLAYAEKGSGLVFPDSPSYADDGTGHTHPFSSWKDGDGNTVTAGTTVNSNLNLTAVYDLGTTILYHYSISYVLPDGTTAATTLPTSYTVEDQVTLPDDLTRAHYAFLGWTGPGYATATKGVTIATGSMGNRTYQAMFVQTEFEVTFVDGNGATVQSSYVTKGGYATYSGTTPTKASDTQYEYYFDSWDKDPATTVITETTVFTASFDKGTLSLTYTFDSTNHVYAVSGISDTTLSDVIVPAVHNGADGVYPVTTVSEKAFYQDTAVKTVTIPNSVTSLATNAFHGCSSLTTIHLGSELKSIGDRAFQGCSVLTNVTLPSSLTTIGQYAFSGCKVLGAINLPSSMTTLGGYAFSGCTGLTSVTLPDSVTSIDAYAFYGCTGLTSVTIPDSVTSIGGYAFQGCTGLASVTIPDSVTSIGYCAFEGCTGLTTVTIPDSVTSIGGYAFSGCTGLTSVTIPDLVIYIRDYAFQGCTGLASVTIPDSVTSIGYCAFEGCTGLTTVTIPDSVTSIGGFAFSSCTGLTTVTIPDSVTSIGDYAFYGCTGLTSVTIPDSVTSIGNNAFLTYNSSITSLTYSGTIAQWTANFGSTPIGHSGTIHCSDGDYTQAG